MMLNPDRPAIQFRSARDCSTSWTGTMMSNPDRPAIQFLLVWELEHYKLEEGSLRMLAVHW
jgi:hypothetical protein